MAKSHESEESYPVEWETPDCPLCGSDRWRLRMRAGDLLHRTLAASNWSSAETAGTYTSARDRLANRSAASIRKIMRPHTPRGCRGGTARLRRATGAEFPRLASLSAHPAGSGAAELYHWLTESYGEIMPPLDAPGRRALELGCAGGRFLEMLRGWVASRRRRAGLAPGRRARQLGFVHHGAFEPGLFADNSFDAVFAWMVLEHLHDPLRTLDEIQRILKPGGWFIFSVPNWGCWEPAVFARYWYCLQPPIHLHSVRPAACAHSGQAGYQDIRVIHQHNVFNLLGSLGLWLRTAFPQRRLGHAIARLHRQPVRRWPVGFGSRSRKLLAWLHRRGRLTVTARVDNGEGDGRCQMTPWGNACDRRPRILPFWQPPPGVSPSPNSLSHAGQRHGSHGETPCPARTS